MTAIGAHRIQPRHVLFDHGQQVGLDRPIELALRQQRDVVRQILLEERHEAGAVHLAEVKLVLKVDVQDGHTEDGADGEREVDGARVSPLEALQDIVEEQFVHKR